MIKILGLGPGAKEALTMGAIDVLKNDKNVFFRTEIHPTVEFIRELGIKFESYDEKYSSKDSFDEVYNSIAEDILEKQKELGEVVYAVPGHPLVAEKSVNLIIEKCEQNNVEYEILPAVSFVDALMEALKIDPVEGIKIIDAFEMNNHNLDKREGMIITQVYDQYISSEVKLALSEYYPDEYEIYFVRAAGVKGLESVRKIKIYEIDRQEDVDYLTSLYIPKGDDSIKDFGDLVKVMERLRGEDGCEWDKEQTHESLKKYLIEEAYEVLEAIDEEDEFKLIEELGDVLLQVVFHAQIGGEEGYFNINDVIKEVTEKLIRRHPHIFKDNSQKTVEEVEENWDNIKREEHGHQSVSDTLRHVPKNLPALMRAEKVQKKAAKVGFDWDDVEPALEKVHEEYCEIKEVYKSNDEGRILEELGDLLFAAVNVARFLNVDAEEALTKTTQKFIKRFEYIEQEALKQGKQLENMSLEEMDFLWEEAKKGLKK